MGLRLINSPYSTCSQKVRLCLREKGLAFEEVWIDFRKEEHLSPEYLGLNPNGVVPTLLHDGRPVIDSSVIMEYLDEVFPDPPLSLPDAHGRATMRAWLRYFEEVPTAAIRAPSFEKVFIRHYRDLSQAEFESAAGRRPLRTAFYRRMGRNGFDPAELQASEAGLAQTVARMERQLSAGPWLCGAVLTLADLCVAPIFDRMEDLGMARLWQGAPAVTRWFAALRARPAYAAAFYPSSRLSERYEDLQGVQA